MSDRSMVLFCCLVPSIDCISNFNSSMNSFYINGCSKLLDVTAGDQTMGIGVINAFMIVIAFAAIPILIESPYPD